MDEAQKHHAKQKKAYTKEYILLTAFISSSRTGKNSLQCQKSEQWLPLESGIDWKES